jgi:serine/threonine protein kinase
VDLDDLQIIGPDEKIKTTDKASYSDFVRLIDYEKDLKMEKDWQFVLSQGLQGTVERILLEVDGAWVPVAVKKTYLNQQRRRRIEVFKRELRALKRINHEGVVKLNGLGIDPFNEFVFLAIELCECSGWTYVEQVFQKQLQSSSFPLEIILSWAELADGCAEMSA